MDRTGRLAALLGALFVAVASGQTKLANETTLETLSVTSEKPSVPLLPLTIYYEALCPDSMYFIRRRLYNALLENDWWSRTDLQLYPFGHASFYNNTETGKMEVYCQHGDEECELNALHACVLEHLGLRQAFSMINCLLRSYFNNIDECANHLKLDVTAAKECKRTRQTVDILLPYGRKTLPLGLSFVPSIVFDNNFQSYEQSSIRYNFEHHFCRQYELRFKIKLPTCR